MVGNQKEKLLPDFLSTTAPLFVKSQLKYFYHKYLGEELRGYQWQD